MTPLCVYQDADTSYLYTSGQVDESCTGYVLMTIQDYAGSIGFTQLFGYPDPLEFGLVFSLCFGVVLGFAVWAHSVGAVAGMFNSTLDEEL